MLALWRRSGAAGSAGEAAQNFLSDVSKQADAIKDNVSKQADAAQQTATAAVEDLKGQVGGPVSTPSPQVKKIKKAQT